MFHTYRVLVFYFFIAGAIGFPGFSLLGESPGAIQFDEQGHARKVLPFFKQHCVSCHGADQEEGKLRLDLGPSLEFLDPATRGKWNEIVNVLNGHEMPPENEPQPAAEEVGSVVDWITDQMTRAELVRRDSAVVIRRLNREEYRNTIRELTGIDLDVSNFPLDPPAGGFDNNGKALSVSPMLMELYYDTAKRILNDALVTGSQPESIRWRFEPESGDNDSNRVVYGKNRAIVNGGRNPVEDGMKILHHDSWDKHLNARDFVVPSPGTYLLRVRGANHVPDRNAVVESAAAILAKRRDEQTAKDPKREKSHQEQYERDLDHFRSDRMYDFGPARIKLVLNFGGQPRVLTEFDVDASRDDPKIWEFKTKFTTDRAGITLEYAYSIPRVLENFWMQTGDTFARPTAFIDWFEIEGPIYESWPPESHQKILFPSALAKTNVDQYAKEVILRFMRRAFRRPLGNEEVEAKYALYQTAMKQGESFEQAIKSPLVAILCSPHFLYQCEPIESAVANVRRPLNEHELATRLSYFLWSSMPDDALFRAAAQGNLRDAEGIKRQVERMLKDPRAEAFKKNFTSQWLGLGDVGANPPAADLYPQYDRHLEQSIVEESQAFFAEILDHELSVMNFVRSDFVVINERLARFYGLANVRGDHFRRVAVPEGVQRGGIVTQASIHTITSNGTRTSPVKRGTWIMKTLLGIDPGLPVANAGDIAPKVPGLDKATVRQRLEIHRTLPQCARCHNKIDPLGFALENYNACGEWRTQEGFGYKGRIERNDPLIDASSKMIDGTEITGVAGLQQALLEKEDLFLKCLASKLMTYALGRELGIADQPAINAAAAHVKRHEYSMKSLIEFIVMSDSFRNK